jgi:RHS repeat-associated protein
MTYDESNRLDSVTPISGGTEYYTYAPDNKRIGILKADDYTEEWTLYGARGERVGVYSLGVLTSGGVGTYYWPFTRIEKDVWFAGHLIWQYRPMYSASGITGSVEEDRNGTDLSASARFLPYGEEITSTIGDRMKFATYTRDSFTALDYADQRYYASSYGRFNTADQYLDSAGPGDPGSWNRYNYTRGDPVNRNDAQGLRDDLVDGGDWSGGYDVCEWDNFNAACGDPWGPVGSPNLPPVGGNSFTPVLAPALGPPLVICALDPLCVGTAVAGVTVVVGLPRLGGVLVNGVLRIAGGIIGVITQPLWNACSPPVGTIGYRYDAVPPSRPHQPYPGDHVHLYVMQQNPNNGQCFWSPAGVTAPPPPPGAVPIAPATGGGPR